MIYSFELVQKVWKKADILEGKDPELWRVDDQGILIYRHHYGNDDSVFGWEISHIIPYGFGGSDIISNLKPVHCRINRMRIFVGRLLGRQLRRKAIPT